MEGNRVLRSSSESSSVAGKRKRDEEEEPSKRGKVSIPDSPLDQEYEIDTTWVSPSRMRNHLMKDPVIDWLAQHSSPFSVKNPTYDNLITQAVKEPRSMNSFT